MWHNRQRGASCEGSSNCGRPADETTTPETIWSPQDLANPLPEPKDPAPERVFEKLDELWKNADCGSELDYAEQISWVLFLKCVNDLEQNGEPASGPSGKPRRPVFKKKFRWTTWAAPEAGPGEALTGDRLRRFVDDELFPYLKKFRDDMGLPDTVEYKIGEIFGELKNKFQNGRHLRETVNQIDALNLRPRGDNREIVRVYEKKITEKAGAPPRPLIKAVVTVVDPAIGDKIYDGACGSAGFLCEAFNHLNSGKTNGLTTERTGELRNNAFYGKEKKSPAYTIGVVNTLLHGIENPDIARANALAENPTDAKGRYHVVLGAPPFGGREREEIRRTFPFETGETAFLFLQHFINVLRPRGRAGIVAKRTFLSNADEASVGLRRELLETCNLHTILDLPEGVFSGTSVKAVVLFFEKGVATKKIWYHQLDPGRKLDETNPLNDGDLDDFIATQKKFGESPSSWTIDMKDVNKKTFDLSVNNPRVPENGPAKHPQEILARIKLLDGETAETLKSLSELL